jgi:hypothetical protein
MESRKGLCVHVMQSNCNCKLKTSFCSCLSVKIAGKKFSSIAKKKKKE